MAAASEGERIKNLRQTVEILKKAKNIIILTHKAPDGDTIGSAFALCRSLIKMGKMAKVICHDEIPKKYNYMYNDIKSSEFEPDLIVASDIASLDLMGEKLAPYSENVGLCIDHHVSNSNYADFTMLDPTAAATCEIMAELIDLLGVKTDKTIAECIYTGLATDTGCFRYSNTTSKTLRTAAKMIDNGADAAAINKKLFDTITKARLELEQMVLETIEYHFGGKAAVITITKKMEEKTGLSDADTEGIPSLPAKIEGVEAGITIKEQKDGEYKISLRTGNLLNASEICSHFGGGGHAAAAGCRMEGTLEDVKRAILEAVRVKLADLEGEEGSA